LTNATRLGGKLASSEYSTPSASIRTDFQFSDTITRVEIHGAVKFGTLGNTGNIYLQISSDGINWTTVSTRTQVSTIVFDDLNIPSNSYIKIVVHINSSSTNSGLAFTGIKVHGLPQ
ncbi:MAG: discoidin domain-containing protein, partial [Acholeplasma sp.]